MDTLIAAMLKLKYATGEQLRQCLGVTQPAISQKIKSAIRRQNIMKVAIGLPQGAGRPVDIYGLSPRATQAAGRHYKKAKLAEIETAFIRSEWVSKHLETVLVTGEERTEFLADKGLRGSYYTHMPMVCSSPDTCLVWAARTRQTIKERINFSLQKRVGLTLLVPGHLAKYAQTKIEKETAFYTTERKRHEWIEIYKNLPETEKELRKEIITLGRTMDKNNSTEKKSIVSVDKAREIKVFPCPRDYSFSILQ